MISDSLFRKRRMFGSLVLLNELRTTSDWTNLPNQIKTEIGNEIEKKSEKQFNFVGFSEEASTYQLIDFLHIPTKLYFVLIPPGSFLQGEITHEYARPYQQPQRSVRITNSFLLAKFPVRNGDWHGLNAERKLQPKTDVSWVEAKEWLSHTSTMFRLPSESEWEFACRSNSNSRYFWGDHYDYSKSLTFKNNEIRLTEPEDLRKESNTTLNSQFGTGRHNDFGLYDMSGLIWEYCEDSWSSYSSQHPLDGSTYSNTTSSDIVMRGGSYIDPPTSVISASRGSFPRTSRSEIVGFRIACDVPGL